MQLQHSLKGLCAVRVSVAIEDATPQPLGAPGGKEPLLGAMKPAVGRRLRRRAGSAP
ncbi:MAG: hypothetical protein P8090_19240 [Gammaproteobacteria bacterium]